MLPSLRNHHLDLSLSRDVDLNLSTSAVYSSWSFIAINKGRTLKETLVERHSNCTSFYSITLQ